MRARISRTLIGVLAALAGSAWATSGHVSAQEAPRVEALEWRHIGPFNGGRGTSVVGHPTDPFVFFYGHSSGGLWKTDDAGAYWTPVGEGQFRYASVGAVAIYEKNPDIMYVGLGEPNEGGRDRESPLSADRTRVSRRPSSRGARESRGSTARRA